MINCVLHIEECSHRKYRIPNITAVFERPQESPVVQQDSFSTDAIIHGARIVGHLNVSGMPSTSINQMNKDQEAYLNMSVPAIIYIKQWESS